MNTFALIATMLFSDHDQAWVLDYAMTPEDCGQALVDFAQSEIFIDGIMLTCEVEPKE